MDGAFREFAMRAYTEYNIAVGRYVIMPDHNICSSADRMISS